MKVYGCVVLKGAYFPCSLNKVVVQHQNEAGKNSHEEMRFFDGWNKALDQLVEYMKGL